MNVNQINQNLQKSMEPGNPGQLETVHQERSKGTPPENSHFDPESREGLKKKISLETVQELLSQKEFVRRMLNRSPEFLQIVSEEVKERVRTELEGGFY